LISAATAHEQTFVRTAEGQGALFPKEKASVASEVSGRVAEIVADLGDRVETGQVLLKIDPREYQINVDSAHAALNQANAKLSNARAQFGRAEKLRREKLVSAEQFDQLSAGQKVAAADSEAAAKALAMTEKKLGDTVVRAPFGGFVQKRLVSLGEYVKPTDRLFEMVAIDPIKLLAPVPERYVPLAKIGLKVEVSVAANPDKIYIGQITRIAPALDEASRTLMVEAEVANSDGALKPGYFAHTKVSFGQDQGLFIPQNAVMRYAGVERVFVIEDGVAHAREIKTGAREGDQVEVISGIKAGDRVATSEMDRLADGVLVNARLQS
jgi:membrane fusion protein (multidrug efflux system)